MDWKSSSPPPCSHRQCWTLVLDGRHTCASLLRHLGVDLSVIKEILRHAEISIAADIYIHVSTDQQREALKRIRAALDEPLPAGGKPDLEPEEDGPSERRHGRCYKRCCKARKRPVPHQWVTGLDLRRADRI